MFPLSSKSLASLEERTGRAPGWDKRDKAALCMDESEEASFVVGRSITHQALALPLMSERSWSFSLHFGDVTGAVLMYQSPMEGIIIE